MKKKYLNMIKREAMLTVRRSHIFLSFRGSEGRHAFKIKFWQFPKTQKAPSTRS